MFSVSVLYHFSISFQVLLAKLCSPGHNDSIQFYVYMGYVRSMHSTRVSLGGAIMTAFMFDWGVNVFSLKAVVMGNIICMHQVQYLESCSVHQNRQSGQFLIYMQSLLLIALSIMKS